MSSDKPPSSERLAPFAEHLGIRLRGTAQGSAAMELDLQPHMFNVWDSGHGGAIMTLLDATLSMAARTMDEGASGALTVELKVSFIGAASGTLRADARCLHRGKSIAFCEGQVHDAAGHLVATASGTYMIRSRRRATTRAVSPD